jgi:hypothetical protein
MQAGLVIRDSSEEAEYRRGTGHTKKGLLTYREDDKTENVLRPGE